MNPLATSRSGIRLCVDLGVATFELRQNRLYLVGKGSGNGGPVDVGCDEGVVD